MDFTLQLVNYVVEEQCYKLFEPDKEAVTASYHNGDIAFPYWSQVWPAAIGLAQFILQNPRYIVGKKVLELAAGLGLPSLVAAATGAAWVITSDYVAAAVAAMQQTITYHHVQNFEVRLLDWTALPNDLTAEVLLLSDVNYDEQLFSLQEKTISRFLQSGTTVIISTPQRLIAKQAIQSLLPFCRHQAELSVFHQQQAIAISLFILKK